MKKRLKATTIDENFRTFLASKRSSGVREKTILSYQQAYQAINKHYSIGENGYDRISCGYAKRFD